MKLAWRTMAIVVPLAVVVACTDEAKAPAEAAYAARSRLHVLSREKKLPPGMDQATLETAHSSLASLEAEWAAAANQYKAGDWSGAVAKAKELDSKGRELLGTLGAQPP